jgi:Tripartite tricarboxylate transporter TctB family
MSAGRRAILRRADIWAGLLFIGVGATLLWAGADYPMGRPARIGPGYMPRLLSFAMMGIGFLMMLRAVVADRGTVDLSLAARPLILVPGAVLVFAVVFERFGLGPAILAAVGVANFAAPDNTWKSAVAVGLAIAAFSWLLFVRSLKLPLPMLTP